MHTLLSGPPILEAAHHWELAAETAILAGYNTVPMVWDWGDIVDMHFALGANWTPKGGNSSFKALCSFPSLLGQVQSLSVQQQAMVGLTAVWSNQTVANAALLKQLGTAWYDRLRVTGR